MDSAIERLDVASACLERFDPPVVALRDSGHWPGVRLEEWAGESSDLPESVLPLHGMAFNLGAEVAGEVYWPGHRRVRGKFTSGQTVLYPAGMPYQVVAKGHWRGLYVGVEPSLLRDVSSARTESQVQLLPYLGAPDAFIWHAVCALAEDIRADYPSGSLYGEAISVALAAHLVRRYATSKIGFNELPVDTGSRKARVREYLLDQLGENLSLASMVDIAGMDVYAFSRWFKATFGVPPYRFLVSARIERAKSLLSLSPISVLDVAMQCGFYSQSHFSTVFKRVVGVSPSFFRENGRR